LFVRTGTACGSRLRAHVSHTIMWQGPDAYQSDLAAFIAEQQHIFDELARQLSEQNLLSEAEAKSIRPRLQIRVWDQRTARESALPVVATRPENITLEPF
jgi:hypothetical protein